MIKVEKKKQTYNDNGGFGYRNEKTKNCYTVIIKFEDKLD